MSSKLPLLTDLAGAQAPTYLVYVVHPGIDPLGSFKSTLNDLFAQITKNVSGGVIGGIDGSGSNVAGGDLLFAGGKGTGNAIPGVMAVKYPLIGASGAVLQSLSANSYPLVTSLYSLANTPAIISNTAAETSVFTGATPSAGSTVTIEGGISRVGTRYLIRVIGLISNTGTPTIQMKVKVGGIVLLDTTPMTMVSLTNGRFWITAELQTTAIGAAGTITTFGRMEWSRIAAGLNTFDTGVGGSAPTVIDLTAPQAIDVSLQWGTANASNQWQVFEIAITRER